MLKILSGEGVTFTSLVPSHYIAMLGLPEETKQAYDVSRVNKLMISSAPARRDTKLAIMEYFSSSQLYELYGSTEAGWVTLLRPGEQLTKLGSIGREWTGCGAIKLLDAHGGEVPAGEIGSCSRAPHMRSRGIGKIRRRRPKRSAARGPRKAIWPVAIRTAISGSSAAKAT